jgi:hypothetical protein
MQPVIVPNYAFPVTIGEALAGARNKAGLSVGEVGKRTRIRETVIRSIEQDDYGACGGDLYVRGYVRAIASAVGIDAQPLIREYELECAEEPDRAEKIAPEPVASEPLTPVPRWPARAQPARKARAHSRRRVAGIAALAIVVLVTAGFAGTRVVSSLRSAPAARETAGHGFPVKTAKGNTAKAAAVSQAGPREPVRKVAAPPRSVPLSSRPLSSRPLPIALAEAFGPDGTSDGDNPQSALSVITPGATQPWQTDWYTTADFGQLKPGTGLLLDMGRTVTITSVSVDLGADTGADLQLRAGGTPVPGGLSVVASAYDAGGTFDLTLTHPARARYVLVWFTLLPLNAAGKYQASVYQVGVSGVH